MTVTDLTKIVAMREIAAKLVDELDRLLARHKGVETIPENVLQFQHGRVKHVCKELVETAHPIFHVLTGAKS
jgi:hypothetical protein